MVKKVVSIVLKISIMILSFGLGYLMCFSTNGYPRALYALDKTRSDFGQGVLSKLEQYKKIKNTESMHISKLLGYTPEVVCVQVPYQTAANFRSHLQANTLGFREISDSENLIWVINKSYIGEYIAINRIFVDFKTAVSTKHCFMGAQTYFFMKNVNQEYQLTLEEK
jgi:hypothetical protein